MTTVIDQTMIYPELQTQLAGKAPNQPATASQDGMMVAADKSKLDGIQSGATANSTDAQLRDRTTHTGVQPISSVTNLQSSLDTIASNVAAKVATSDLAAITSGLGADLVGTVDGVTVQTALLRGYSAVRSIRSFGAKGDGTNEDAAVQAAFDWLNDAAGRALSLAAGVTYIFSTDKYILQNNSAIIGFGNASARLQGSSNARIIVGQAQPTAATPPVKAGTQISNVLISNVQIVPSDNHSGEALLLDYATNVSVRNCVVGPNNHNGTAAAHGIKTNWVQFVYIDSCNFNTNGAGIYITLPYTSTRNEDHYSIRNCQFYQSYSYYSGFTPTVVYFDTNTTAAATISDFNFVGNYCLRNPASDGTSTTINTGAFTVYQGTASRTTTTLLYANIRDNSFVKLDYILDFLRQHAGTEASSINFSGNYVSTGRGTVFNSGNFTNCTVNVSGNHFITGVNFVDGIQCCFTGRNAISGFTTIFVTSINRHRYWNKENNSGLTSVRMGQTVSTSVAAGSTYVDLTLSLTAAPTSPRCWTLGGSNWITSFSFSGASATSIRVWFSDPPATAQTIYCRVEVEDNL